MASAMRAWGEVKPNAIRCSSWIVVDSISAFDRSWVRAASMAAWCLRTLRPSATKAGVRLRAAQPSHRSRSGRLGGYRGRRGRGDVAPSGRLNARLAASETSARAERAP